MHRVSIVCFGELMIDMVAEERGSLETVQSFTRFAGGAAANVAAQNQRLGGKPVFMGKLGRDGFGKYLLRYLEQNGVDTHAVVFDDERRTTVAYVTLDEDGIPSYLFYRKGGACVNLRPEEMDQQAIVQADIFYFSTLTLTEEPLRSTALYAIKAARRTGALVAPDLNYRASAWPSEKEARNEIDRVLEYVDILKVNREELTFITDGCADNEACVQFVQASKTLKMLVLTDGAAGSVIFLKDQLPLHIPACHDRPVVDTTGAGDSYMGAFLYALEQNGLELDRDSVCHAGMLAAKASAYTVSGKGAIAAMPDAQALEG